MVDNEGAPKRTGMIVEPANARCGVPPTVIFSVRMIMRTAIIFALLPLVLAGCGKIQTLNGVLIEKKQPFFFGLTCVRDILKDELLASAFGNKDRFTKIRVGSPAKPFTGDKAIYVRLPDSTIVNLAAPDCVSVIRKKAELLNVCREGSIYDPLSDTFETKYVCPEGTQKFQIYRPYEFFVKNDRLIWMTITYDPDAYDFHIHDNGTKTKYKRYNCPAPAIGCERDNLQSLPFTTAQFWSHFGRPDRIIESFQE